MPITSEPAPGSVKAIAARQPSVEASRGSQRCFCSSVPERSSGRTGNIVAPIGAERPAQPQESSSAIRLEVTAETPPPPYSTGIACEVSPSAAALPSSSAGSPPARPTPRDRPQLRSANSCASAQLPLLRVRPNEIQPSHRRLGRDVTLRPRLVSVVRRCVVRVERTWPSVTSCGSLLHGRRLHRRRELGDRGWPARKLPTTASSAIPEHAGTIPARMLDPQKTKSSTPPLTFSCTPVM